MGKYVSKKDLIEAVKFDGFNSDEVVDMLGGSRNVINNVDGLFVKVNTDEYIVKEGDSGFKVMDKKNFDESYQEIEYMSDGYHTFDELYDYRMLYNAMAFNDENIGSKYNVVKSKRHHDGDECFGGGWFVVMADLPTGQISNHYPMKYWNLFHCNEVETAPEWDGHSPSEAAKRIYNYLNS